jgi:hypothetical protein
MIRFKELHESIAASKRIGIDHLNQLKPLDFINLIKFINDELGGRISDKNASMSVKVDGFSLRFGLDSQNEFFIESSNSGPQFTGGAFSQYTIDRHGENNPISIAYDTIFKDLKSNKKLMKILKDNNQGKGIKIVCECLYTPIGKVTGDKIRFVAIDYDKNKLGAEATFVLFKVQDGEGHNLDNSILAQIKKLSNDKFLFTDANTSIDEVDFSIEIKDVLKFAAKYPDLEMIVKSRKQKDKYTKNLIKDTLKEYQDKMGKRLLKAVRDGKFGKEFEGIVIQLLSGKTFKVVSNDFSSRKNDKHRPK